MHNSPQFCLIETTVPSCFGELLSISLKYININMWAVVRSHIYKMEVTKDAEMDQHIGLNLFMGFVGITRHEIKLTSCFLKWMVIQRKLAKWIYSFSCISMQNDNNDDGIQKSSKFQVSVSRWFSYCSEQLTERLENIQKPKSRHFDLEKACSEVKKENMQKLQCVWY